MSSLLTAQQVCTTIATLRQLYHLCSLKKHFPRLSSAMVIQTTQPYKVSSSRSMYVYPRNRSPAERMFQEVGCLIGALSNLWIGDKLGRRRTIILGGIVMIIGAILQATSFSYAQIIVARIITGLGNGLNVGFETYRLNVRSKDADVNCSCLSRRVFPSRSSWKLNHDRRQSNYLWDYDFVSIVDSVE
jgi:hypothetical protein